MEVLFHSTPIARETSNKMMRVTGVPRFIPSSSVILRSREEEFSAGGLVETEKHKKATSQRLVK
jgi:hypothetical protein